jgi:putative ABC transport system ATP-binding protein
MSLKITDLSKTFRIAGEKRTVLNSINLEMDRGELISITGKSGCGKTTLLNIISGLLPPTTGEVFINSRKLRRFPDILSSRIRNREIGFIFQTFRLLNEETVLANILLPARLKGKLSADTKKYADRLLSDLGISLHKNMKAGLLSGGQKQRVAIARALINCPSLILADEPTANLDSETSGEIIEILNDLKDEGRSVLVITHSDYMHSLSDRSYNMEDGRLLKIK